MHLGDTCMQQGSGLQAFALLPLMESKLPEDPFYERQLKTRP